MALSMSRPWKHPDSGYYWFRRRVPEDLRAVVGKREERLSLGTRDPAEAKRLHALKLAEIEERWSNLRQSRHELSADAISREAALAITSIQRQLDLDPYQVIDWDVDVGASLWAHNSAQGDLYTDVREQISPLESRLDAEAVVHIQALIESVEKGNEAERLRKLPSASRLSIACLIKVSFSA